MQPRLLNVKQAASYCGVSATAFLGSVGVAVPPLRIGRRKLWDRKCLDHWLDEKGGLVSELQPSDGDAYEERRRRKRQQGDA